MLSGNFINDTRKLLESLSIGLDNTLYTTRYNGVLSEIKCSDNMVKLFDYIANTHEVREEDFRLKVSELKVESRLKSDFKLYDIRGNQIGKVNVLEFAADKLHVNIVSNLLSNGINPQYIFNSILYNATYSTVTTSYEDHTKLMQIIDLLNSHQPTEQIQMSINPIVRSILSLADPSYKENSHNTFKNLQLANAFMEGQSPISYNVVLDNAMKFFQKLIEHGVSPDFSLEPRQSHEFQHLLLNKALRPIANKLLDDHGLALELKLHPKTIAMVDELIQNATHGKWTYDLIATNARCSEVGGNVDEDIPPVAVDLDQVPRMYGTLLSDNEEASSTTLRESFYTAHSNTSQMTLIGNEPSAVEEL